MKAIRIHEYGSPDVLRYEEVEEPQLAQGKVLIRLQTAGVNFVDIYHRKGTYAAPAELPFILGLEGAGIVEAVGPTVTTVKVGDKVAYTGQIGSYAEKIVLPQEKLIVLPKDFSFEMAAAFPLQGMTAHYLLHEFRTIKPRDVVLIHAAAGGMGLLLVQWAKHLEAHVIGTVSSEEKAAIAKEAGADDVINYTKQDFVKEVKKITHEHGADFIIDGVGIATFMRDIDAASVRGHIVLYGSASGIPDPIDPRLFMPKSLTLSSGSLHNFTKSPEELLMRSKAVIEAIQAGWLHLRLDRILPLADAKEAHKLLEGRSTTGKIILKIM